MILVSLIGWQLASLAGVLVATPAIMVPSCSLAFMTARMISRWSEVRWIGLLKAGLVPSALGLMPASGVSMMRTADRTTLAVVISLATAGFVVCSVRNPLWALAAGTCVNIAALHSGFMS